MRESEQLGNNADHEDREDRGRVFVKGFNLCGYELPGRSETRGMGST